MNAGPRAIVASAIVRIARHESGMSAAELSRRAGVAAGTVHRIEAGLATPRRETVIRLLEACAPER